MIFDLFTLAGIISILGFAGLLVLICKSRGCGRGE